MSAKAKEHFEKEWGTGFESIMFKNNDKTLRMTIEELFETMESYKEGINLENKFK